MGPPGVGGMPVFIQSPEEIRGRWAERFPRIGRFICELGLRKCPFLAEMGLRHPEINFIGIDQHGYPIARCRFHCAYAQEGRSGQYPSVFL